MPGETPKKRATTRENTLNAPAFRRSEGGNLIQELSINVVVLLDSVSHSLGYSTER